MYEIEEKDDELTLECDAGGHYLTVTYLFVNDDMIDAWLSLKAQPRTLWERIKLAWEALFSKYPFEVNEISLAYFDKAHKLKVMAEKIEKICQKFEQGKFPKKEKYYTDLTETNSTMIIS